MFEIESMLDARPGTDPCGPGRNLDSGFLAMERLAAGMPERRRGAGSIAGEPWTDCLRRLDPHEPN
jgi:hypothetical protein